MASERLALLLSGDLLGYVLGPVVEGLGWVPPRRGGRALRRRGHGPPLIFAGDLRRPGSATRPGVAGQGFAARAMSPAMPRERAVVG